MLWHFLTKHRRSFFVLLFIGIIYFFSNAYFDKALIGSVEMYTKEYFETASNNVIKNDLIDLLDESLMSYSYNTEGRVIKASLNTKKVNEIETLSSSIISEMILELNQTKLSINLPIGYFFTKKFYMTDGFKLNIRIEPTGSHESSIETSVESYGVNSSMIMVYLVIKLDAFIKIPLIKQATTFENRMLLSCDITHGEIPNYYFVGTKQVPYVNLEG